MRVAVGAIFRIYSVSIYIAPVFASSHAEEHKHGHAKITKAEVSSLFYIYNFASDNISEHVYTEDRWDEQQDH